MHVSIGIHHFSSYADSAPLQVKPGLFYIPDMNKSALCWTTIYGITEWI
jgi:hypothetical protein